MDYDTCMMSLAFAHDRAPAIAFEPLFKEVLVSTTTRLAAMNERIDWTDHRSFTEKTDAVQRALNTGLRTRFEKLFVQWELREGVHYSPAHATNGVMYMFPSASVRAEGRVFTDLADDDVVYPGGATHAQFDIVHGTTRRPVRLVIEHDVETSVVDELRGLCLPPLRLRGQ